ncbi:MAG TPA: MFS transporter, partial [Hyphomicrobium sp.]
MTIHAESSAPASSVATQATGRWLQLILGVLCMTMIANLQYGWTLFVNPIASKFGWELAAIQLAFTIFVLTETWLIPFEGYLEDRLGPRPLVLFGGIMVAIAWVMNSYADSLTMFYIAQGIGGIGAGAVYGTCVGNALKWFPERRGFAAGLTAAGFGMGSALTIIPISKVIASEGYEAAFLWFGILQGAVIIIASSLLRSP